MFEHLILIVPAIDDEDEKKKLALPRPLAFSGLEVCLDELSLC